MSTEPTTIKPSTNMGMKMKIMVSAHKGRPLLSSAAVCESRAVFRLPLRPLGEGLEFLHSLTSLTLRFALN
jgi:hypothetical protein